MGKRSEKQTNKQTNVQKRDKGMCRRRFTEKAHKPNSSWIVLLCLTMTALSEAYNIIVGSLRNVIIRRCYPKFNQIKTNLHSKIGISDLGVY